MRKNKGLMDELYETLVAAPSWVGPVFAVLSYPLFRYLIPGFFPKGPLEPLTGVIRGLAWLAPVLVLLVWLTAEFKKWTDRVRLDRTGGLGDIRAMSWSEFEALVGEAYRRRGFLVEQTGSASGDGGVDLVLLADGRKTLVQCKQWRSSRVGVKVVREMRGAMADSGAARGIVVCSGSFTREAETFADRNGIELVAGRALQRMISEVKRSTSSGRVGRRPEHAARSVSEEEAVPSCPTCGSPMVLRTARRGRNAGGQFWGCSRYPACRGTRQAK